MEKVSDNDPTSFLPAKRQKNSTLAKLISDLPDEILENILELAVGTKKSNGMLNASLVCSKWNQIISESPRIMSVLSPTVPLWRSMSDVNMEKFEITRKYRKFTLSDDTGVFIVETMSTISTCLTDSLQKLSLCNLELDPSCFSAMSSLKLLKRLSISRCTAEPVNVNPISFELNHLKIWQSPDCILDWINCKKLKMFEYDAGDDDYWKTRTPGASTINFLNRLEQLDELTLICYKWNSANSDVPQLQPKFMWKKLKLHLPWNTHNPSNVAKSNMIALGSASASDGEAHIKFYSEWLSGGIVSDFTIKFLNSCKKIKSLKLEGDDDGNYDSSIIANLSKLRVMDEVETLRELEFRFKYAAGLIGLKSLLDKMPNLKDLTLDLRGDDYIDESDDDEDDDPMNDPISIRLTNLEILTIRPPMHREKEKYEINGFDSTAMFWETFSFGSSLKHLKVLLSGDDETSKWHSNNAEVDEEYSPIRLYKDWASAENRSSVESCTLELARHDSDPFRGMMKTRDEVELEIFGRPLNADEKKFFSEIIVDGWKV